ncbi:MAG TPA: hypothetical protein VJ740_02535 [Hyphomicrobiaceae bacterium]|jgi:hypothetical protein|nr:hypothetical protein [Hyphomicrobiaceae bacterium]
MAERLRTSSDEHPTKVPTVKARQGTGPRDMVSVLTISLALAIVAGVAILAYWLT